MFSGVLREHAPAHRRCFERPHDVAIPIGSPGKAEANSGRCCRLSQSHNFSVSAKGASHFGITIPVVSIKRHLKSGLDDGATIGDPVLIGAPNEEYVTVVVRPARRSFCEVNRWIISEWEISYGAAAESFQVRQIGTPRGEHEVVMA